MSDLPEAGAVAFFSYKRTDGYEVSLTLRGDNGTTVLERIDAAIESLKRSGATPLAKNQSFAKSPNKKAEPILGADGTRLCPIHGTAMQGRPNKYKPGELFYSHAVGDGEWCRGK